MSVHVRFETPEEVSDKIYDMLQANIQWPPEEGQQ